MAYSGASATTDTSVSGLIHAQFRDNIIYALESSEELSHFKRFQASESELPLESVTFNILTSEGSSSVAAMDPVGRKLPVGRPVSFSQGSFRRKEYDSAIEFNNRDLRNLEFAIASGDKTSAAYASAEKLVADIVGVKSALLEHVLLTDIYGDGTGVIGQLNAAPVMDTNGASTVNLVLKDAYNARGSASWFRLRSNIVLATTNGALSTFTTGNTTNAAAVDSLRVDAIDVENKTITCSSLDSNGAVITNVGATTATTNGLVFLGDKRAVQSSNILLTDLTSITDYDSLSQHIVGLGSLVSADGRTVQGLARSGMNASVIFDCSNNTLKPEYLGKLIAKLKLRWRGAKKFKWRTFLLNDLVMLYLQEQYQADRRLVATGGMVPSAYGNTTISYAEPISGNGAWQFKGSDYCPVYRVYLLPEPGAGGEFALSMPMTPVERVFDGMTGSDGFLPVPASGGYWEDAKIKYERLHVALFSEIPAGLGAVENFSLT